MHASLLHAQSSICAEVKIQIDQKVSLERQAFDAKLNIRNGLEGIQVEQIDVNVVFKDQDGNEASGLFATMLSSTDGISGSVEDGTGTVAGATTGEAHWLIIPSAGAGGNLPQGKNYLVGATITYRMTGDTSTRTVEVVPETITVKPQPMLDLDYFLPGDVYADDPLTPVVEPTVPFTLGVRVTNSGFGPAMQTTIESAQPRIVDNEQGLLIGFQIIGSFLDGQSAQPSLLIDFGDIQPSQSRVGRWLMTTTLAGKFLDFDAAYTHSDALGGELTSLIGDVNTHLLTHDVLVDLPGRDQVQDFLAQAVNAADTDPYHVFESDGSSIADVVQQFAPSFNGTVLSFDAPSAGQVVYARAPMGEIDPAQEVHATRSDGKVVPASNVWYSKRRNASGDGWLYFINIFEAQPDCAGGTCSYTLGLGGEPDDASLAGLVYEDANANGVQDPDEPGLQAVSVTLNGASAAQTVTTAADGSFLFAKLTAGTYSVAVAAVPGHYAGVATPGDAGGSGGTSSITDIALAAGTQASGYDFAQVPEPAQQVADLAVTALTASTTNPSVGEAFTLSVQLANGGPDTADVAAGLVLPPTIEVLSANPSVGTFDPATGYWAVGSLATSGSAILTIQVQANAVGGSSVEATVTATDAAVGDPDTGNNLASLELNIQPLLDLNLSAEFARQSRVLALVSCTADDPAPDCPANRADALDNYLDSQEIEHEVTSGATTFRDEMRSGHWNVYWIDNGSAQLDAGVLAELGMAVFRGDALVVDGRGADSSVTDDWAGVSYAGPRSTTSAEPVTFQSSEPFDFSGLAVSGRKYAYQASTARVLANWPDGAPAILAGTHGQGTAFIFGFDLLGTLNGNAAYEPLFQQLVTATAPPLPVFLTAGSYVAVKTHLSNAGSAITVDERLSVPSGAMIANAAPATHSRSGQELVWRTPLEPAGSFNGLAGIRATDGPAFPIQVNVTQAGGDSSSLSNAELDFAVTPTADQASFARDAISALSVSRLDDKVLRAAARAALDAALAARSEGRQNIVLAQVSLADLLLAQISGADTSGARTELGWLLQGLQREWYTMLPACSAAAGPPVVDSGVGFVPFASQEGLYVHQVNRGGMEWRLGSNIYSRHKFVKARTDLDSNHVYDWALSYDAFGNGTISVMDGDTELASQTWMGSDNGMLRSGNGLRLSLTALFGIGETSITVGVNRLEGATFANTIRAKAKRSIARDDLYFYGEQLSDGFAMSGTIEVDVPDPIWFFTPPRLLLGINSGSTSCKNPAR